MTGYPGFSFEVTHRHGGIRARTGRLTTPHGTIETPAFVFCATKGAVKAATPAQLQDCGTQAILSNTYHLMLQPGADTVAAMGGLHKFAAWPGPTFTDSGGFQIFSLGLGKKERGDVDDDDGASRSPLLIRISEEGAEFRSFIDGTRHLLTPESSMDIQRKIGADLIFVLDECPPEDLEHDEMAQSMALTHRWALRSLEQFQRHEDGRQALYGIVQGGRHDDLRRESAEAANALPFFGHGVGGCFGEDKDELCAILDGLGAVLDPSRPIHLLGIGGLRDIWEGAERGMDTFDCVHPTRIARHGGALTRPAGGRERLNLRNAQFREDGRPLEEACDCYACTHFSRAYIHHLLKAGEILGLQLLTLHNVRFMNRMMETIRAAIRDDRFASAKKDWLGGPG